jgi:hypothetical protein
VKLQENSYNLKKLSEKLGVKAETILPHPFFADWRAILVLKRSGEREWIYVRKEVITNG